MPQFSVKCPLRTCVDAARGHGALTIGLTFPDRFRAVSAFAPIVAPGQVPWGHKALGGYLGSDPAVWRKHDAVTLIEDGKRIMAPLVDQGEADVMARFKVTPAGREHKIRQKAFKTWALVRSSWFAMIC